MENIVKEFDQHNGVMTTAELNAAGYYYKKIHELLMRGEIEQIKRGLYQFAMQTSYSDIPAITSLYKDAVICMESALNYYGYTDRNPPAWYIAIPERTSRTRFKIDYPIIKPHFVREDRYEIGITEGSIDGFKVRIYDKERTICDILFHKNKIDAEVFNTAIKRYIADSEKNIPRLIEYSKKLRVEKKCREVIGVWL